MPDDLIVGNRVSFANQFRIPAVSNLRCSWEISRIGLLSCDIPERDLLAVLPTGMKTKDLMRRWVSYTHPTAGTWGGVINSLSNDNGIVSIDAESWASMLRGVATWGLVNTTVITGLATMIQNTAPVTGVTWGGVAGAEGAPDDYTFFDVSQPADFFVDGQDLYDGFLPAVMEVLYQTYGWASSLRTLAWNIDPATRIFTIDPTYGVDRTQTVALADRLHVVSSAWSDDIEDISNRVHLLTSFWIYP